jgi:hypothetical protein
VWSGLVLTFRRELLQGYVAEEGTKVIVFSQFVSYLDLCGIYLRRLGVKFADYRGSMKQDAREAVIKEFTSAIVESPPHQSQVRGCGSQLDVGEQGEQLGEPRLMSG